MGYETHFHGMLEFSRPMKAGELAWIKKILTIGHHWTDAAIEVVKKMPKPSGMREVEVLS
jgi:hypothetical protein